MTEQAGFATAQPAHGARNLKFLLNDCGAERFDQDKLRQVFADGQARVADLANEICVAGQQFDDLILAQTQFPQPVLHVRRRAQLFDAHSDAGFDPTQRAKFAASLVPEG